MLEVRGLTREGQYADRDTQTSYYLRLNVRCALLDWRMPTKLQ
jgi:hypothetical protein